MERKGSAAEASESVEGSARMGPVVSALDPSDSSDARDRRRLAGAGLGGSTTEGALSMTGVGTMLAKGDALPSTMGR